MLAIKKKSREKRQRRRWRREEEVEDRVYDVNSWAKRGFATFLTFITTKTTMMTMTNGRSAAWWTTEKKMFCAIGMSENAQHNENQMIKCILWFSMAFRCSIKEFRYSFGCAILSLLPIFDTKLENEFLFPPNSTILCLYSRHWTEWIAELMWVIMDSRMQRTKIHFTQLLVHRYE